MLILYEYLLILSLSSSDICLFDDLLLFSAGVCRRADCCLDVSGFIVPSPVLLRSKSISGDSGILNGVPNCCASCSIPNDCASCGNCSNEYDIASINSVSTSSIWFSFTLYLALYSLFKFFTFSLRWYISLILSVFARSYKSVKSQSIIFNLAIRSS